MTQGRWGRGSRRLLGLVAAPILIGSCAPTQCAPEPPAPAQTTTTTVAPTTAAPTTTAPAPTGEWAFLATVPSGAHTRWDPCDDPITYVIDRTIPPSPPEEAAIRDALATATAATGFRFQEVGADGDVDIGLQDFPTPEYPSGTLGRGGGNFDRSTGEMTSGLAYVKRGLDAPTLRYALLHEIAHMLGLGHVDSKAEVMYRWALQPWKQQFASGDLEGLRRVGLTMGCFPTQALRVESPEQTIIVH